MVDVRVRKEKDLEGIIPARVLVGIPRLNTERDKHLRAVRWRTELGTAMVLILLMVLGNLYAFYKG